MKHLHNSENGSATILVLIIVIIAIVFILGYSKTTKTWSWGQTQSNAKQIGENVTAGVDTTGSGTIPPPSVSDGSEPQKSTNATNATNAMSINVNVNSGNTGAVNADQAQPASPQQKGAEEEEAAKKDDLERKYDPSNPNPIYSWKESDKVSAPVRYHQEVLEYLNKQKSKIETARNSVGVTVRTWESKLKAAESKAKGDEAVLKKAAALYREADANNDWPVSFAYRSYKKDEFVLKLTELAQTYQTSGNDKIRIQQGYEMLRDSLRKHDKELEMLSNQINRFANNLELIRSGKLTANTIDKINELETAFHESETALDKIMQDAQKTVLIESTLEQTEAEIKLEDILNRYAPLK